MAKFCKNCGKQLGFLNVLFIESSLCSKECRIAYETKISEAERKCTAELSKLEEEIAESKKLPNQQSDYPEAILRMYLTRANESAENRFMRCMWSSWALGGVAVTAFLGGYSRGCSGRDLNAMVDSQDKAKSLHELGIQAMVSRWFWKWYSEKGHPSEEREDDVRVSLLNIQTFLDMKCKDTVNLYLGFDREFLQYMPKDKDAKPPMAFSYVDMFYQRYWECITGEQIVDWARLRFPLESYGQFLAACHHGKRCHPDGKQSDSMLSAADSVLLWQGIIKAGGVMFDEFSKMYQKP